MRLTPRRALAMAASAVAFLSLWAVPSAAAGLVITNQDNGQAFSVAVGQKITVNLRHPGGGGYDFLAPEYNKGVLKMLGEHRLPRAEPRRMGDFGRMVYEFQARNVGQTPLVVPIKRPWEKSETYLRVMITVRP
jgi:predicted secreted protein